MTTAAFGRVRRRRVPRSVAVVGLVVMLATGTVVVHVAMPSWYARMWYPMEHVAAIRAEAAAAGVEPDLLAAVIYRESTFTEDARSDRGAIGLMQVLPETAQWIHRQPGGPAAEPARLAEPNVNIAYGAWYLDYLADKYGSQDFALVAYNGGETNLQEWIATARHKGRTLTLADVPFSETRRFVSAVRDARAIYRRAWSTSLGLR